MSGASDPARGSGDVGPGADEDAELMLRVAGGDRSAFEALFRRYTPSLLGFLSRMVSDRGQAEELAQETFVRIYQARERYEPRAKFSTFLFGIAHNLALNELARAYRKRERPLDGVNLDTLPASERSPEEALDQKRSDRRLEAALGKLPERQRAALLLRAREGLAYDDIALALGTSVSSVKSLLHRARVRLGEILEQDEQDETGTDT